MRRSRKISSILTIGILALGATACGSDSSSSGSSGTDETTSASPSDGDESTAAPASDIKVGMAYDVGGRGDQSFNDAAAAGLDKAKAEFGIEAKEATAVDKEPESAREERLQQLIDAGYNHLVAVGFAYAPAVSKVAKENPDVKFALVDSTDAQGIAQGGYCRRELAQVQRGADACGHHREGGHRHPFASRRRHGGIQTVHVRPVRRSCSRIAKRSVMPAM